MGSCARCKLSCAVIQFEMIRTRGLDHRDVLIVSEPVVERSHLDRP